MSETRKQIDGWDLGILIRLNRRTFGLPFDRVRSELISEVGWLKGGDNELKERLQKLEKLGLIRREKKRQDYTVYFITEKGELLFYENRVKLIEDTIKLLESDYYFSEIEEELKTKSEKTIKTSKVYKKYAEALRVYKNLKLLKMMVVTQ